jgi:hypothetical protein
MSYACSGEVDMGSAWALRGVAKKAATAATRQTIAPL